MQRGNQGMSINELTVSFDVCVELIAGIADSYIASTKSLVLADHVSTAEKFLLPQIFIDPADSSIGID